MSGALDQVFGSVEPPPILPPRAPRPYAEATPLPPAPPPPARFTLLQASDVHAMTPMAWAVKNVFPRKGLAAVYGPWGCGKSFLVVDLLAALGEGVEWFGHKVKEPLRVVYLVLEGSGGIPQRVRAWEIEHGRQFPESVRFVFDAFHLNDRNNVLHLAAAIDAVGGADAVFIDTLNAAAPDMDENSSAGMGMALEGAKELQASVGGLVCLISHTGKDATKGLRGHSSLPAALDAAIEVRRDVDGREWSVAKLKDGIDSLSQRFTLEVVELGHDEDGDAITSCVVRPDNLERIERVRPKVPKGGNQRVIYDALGPLLRASATFGKAGAPAQRPCIELEHAVQRTRDRLAVESARRTERTRQAFTGLVATGVLGCNEGWIWLK